MSYNLFIPNVTRNEVTTQATLKESFMQECTGSDGAYKRSIIEMLPDNIPEIMQQHLEDENALSLKFHKRELSRDDYERVAAGRLFEMITFAEYVQSKFKNLKEGSPEWEQAETAVAISSTLCKIARYPQEYGLDIDPASRIPDGVYIGIKEGTFLMYGLAEAKLGELDARAIDQLHITGSRMTMALIAEQLNEMMSDESQEQNLHPDILELKEKLKGAPIRVNWIDNKGKREPKMSLDLLVPNRGNSFIPKVSVKPEPGLQEEYNLIEKYERINKKASTFYAGDVHRMAQKVLAEMEQ